MTQNRPSQPQSYRREHSPGEGDVSRGGTNARSTGAASGSNAPLRHVRTSQSAFLTAGRSPAEFARAAKHSRRVRFLKLALPLGGTLTIFILVGAYLFSQFNLPTIDPGEANVVNGQLVMNNPKLAGTDSNDRPYTLSAVRAVQDAQKPNRVMLEKIEGRLSIDDTNFARVAAGTGLYDTEAQTLDLDGAVSVDTDDGMTIRMEGASIDIDKGRLVSQRPVTVDTGRAKVSAQTLIVENKGKTIIFENKVRMVLQPIDPANATDGTQ